MATLALDPGPQAHLRAAYKHLSGPPGALRSQASLRHHTHSRTRAHPGEEGRPGDRSRKLSGSFARHPLGSQGPPRHRRHSHDLRSRTLQGPRAYARRCRGQASARCRCGLVAKLSLGALALNDIWFGGQTMNPWLLEEGSSGSSAGPGAATAAALVAFSVGSETEGSIVSPSVRC